MSTEPGGTRPTMGMPSIASGARMPIPGNAEFALWLVVSVLDLRLCWISNHLTIRDFLYTWTVITFAYLFSRGIAKASRVLEQ